MSSAGKIVAGLLLCMLAACGPNTAQDAPPQRWRDVEVRIESRSSPIDAAISEFLVTLTDSRGRPAYNLIVSLRTSDAGAWKQAIQDGQMGVYRTAVKIESGTDPVLQVQIRRKDDEGVLYFPLKRHP